MKNHLFWRKVLILSLAAIISMGVYVFLSGIVYRTGYPLDDAWIHQTFARNLVRYQQLAYFEGIPSAGSTAPLWTLLLSVGYVFSDNNYLWTMLLGLLSLVTFGWLGEEIIQQVTREYSASIPWVGILLIFEWHFVWAAASGMETLLLAVLSLAVLFLLLSHNIHWFLVGLLVGMGVWIRPDAILLLGPVGLYFFINIWKRNVETRDLGKILLGFGVPFIAYLLLNQTISGNFWPNTFYAKQMEYREMLEQPLVRRVWSVFQQHIVGMGVLLLPGFIYKVWDSIRKREWALLAFVIWWFGFIIAYALRLPVAYQHGRYVIPAMPIYLITSISGVFLLWKFTSGKRIQRLLSTVWILSIFLVNAGFYIMGARTYANDVAIIESEMVDTAHWISKNTPADSLVAAHDIGALGFYGERGILDLAGLISPVVLPVIRDEEGLLTLIRKSDAKYFMTFPSWYPEITSGMVPLYLSAGKFSPAAGGENMAVFRIEQE